MPLFFLYIFLFGCDDGGELSLETRNVPEAADPQLESSLNNSEIATTIDKISDEILIKTANIQDDRVRVDILEKLTKLSIESNLEGLRELNEALPVKKEGKFCSDLEPSQVAAGVVYNHCQHSNAIGTMSIPSLCDGKDENPCITSDSFPAVDMATVLPNIILKGVTIAGVEGTFDPSGDNYESIADCSAIGQVGCIATQQLPSADLTGLQAKNIRRGVNISGVIGTYPSLETPLSGSSTVADLSSANFHSRLASGQTFEFFDALGQQHQAVGDADLLASNLRNGITIFSTLGTLHSSLPNCQSDSEIDCVTSASFRAADMSRVLAGNIKSGVIIAGVSGSVSQAPNDCGADGEVNCVASASYRAAAMIQAVAGNIKSGITIAGVSGSVNQIPSNCSSDSEVYCVTSASYRAAAMIQAVAGNIKSGITIAGVGGSVNQAPANCSSDGEVSCVANASYRAADSSQATSANIKSGVSIAGVNGQYPSVAFPLQGADATTDLTAATFDVRIKSATNFEYFDAYGNRHIGSGDNDIVDSNIKSGISIFSTLGNLSASSNCTVDGQLGCVTTASFLSADMTQAIASNIVDGKTIAGISGSFGAQRIFASSANYKGNLGGLAGADGLCQGLADAQSLGGSWIAILSTSTVDAKDRFSQISSVGYKNMLGQLVSATHAGLWDGNIDNRINYDETGTVIGFSSVWSGSQSNGTLYGSSHCSNWTSDSFAVDGAFGNTFYDDAKWVSDNDIICSSNRRLYCAQTSF